MNGTTIFGIACLTIGILRRTASAHRSLAGHARALGNADAAVRCAAARTAVSNGLDRTARLLMSHIARESDPLVLDAIAHAVALRQWEPADRASVAELREWSAERLIDRGGAVRIFGPATTRLADMGGPQRAFKGDDGVTPDRTLNATIAELRALCARAGVERADLLIAGQRLTLEVTPEAVDTIPGDIAQRAVAHSGADGVLGGYRISIEAVPQGTASPLRPQLHRPSLAQPD